MGMGARCKECGEFIPNAIPIADGPGRWKFLCASCSGEKKELKGYNTDHGAVTDMRYHGGRFHSAEW